MQDSKDRSHLTSVRAGDNVPPLLPDTYWMDGDILEEQAHMKRIRMLREKARWEVAQHLAQTGNTRVMNG